MHDVDQAILECRVLMLIKSMHIKSIQLHVFLDLFVPSSNGKRRCESSECRLGKLRKVLL